jgi:succinate dehydrogenase/fumarate reductase flavoprotein subunit
VHGVVIRADGTEHTVRATRGVVLASGGFESSAELTTAHLNAPFGVQVSPAGHDGIAVQLAKEIGADLTGMQDAWWMPGVQLPGEELEGRPLSRVFLGERALPHSIMVNSKGERFANEALAYDQFGAIMREVDRETGTMPNATAWLIFDQNYWEKFGIFGVTPGGDVPDYLHRADTLAGRAARKNDPERLRSAIVGPLARIIRPVLNSPTSSVLGPVDTAPYYALKVEASALGTVGGPKTDAHGRALDTAGNVIPGLYAAGNAGGAPTKGFYGGAGGTISLGLVFGYLAGLEAARRTPDASQKREA